MRASASRVGSAPGRGSSSHSQSSAKSSSSSLSRSNRVLKLNQISNAPNEPMNPPLVACNNVGVAQACDHQLKKATRESTSVPFVATPSSSTTPLPATPNSLLGGDDSASDANSVQSYEYSGQINVEDPSSEKPPSLLSHSARRSLQCLKNQISFRNILMTLIFLCVLLPTLTSSLMVLA